jgi:molybdopterin-containing oxidoreductase family iron-sulfur binding subunit
MEAALNPDAAPRMRGVVEKCNFCLGRRHAADQTDYVPACVEACPTGAITFGDLNDAGSEVAKAASGSETFRLLESLHTEPKIYYRSQKPWVRRAADAPRPSRKDPSHV